jgi:hypothetical protein
VLARRTRIADKTHGDPTSRLRWTTKSTVKLADELTVDGHRVGPDTVARPLRPRLQPPTQRQDDRGPPAPDRYAQFGYLNTQVSVQTALGDLGVGRRLNPCARSIRATVLSDTTRPSRVNASAKFLVDLVVYTSGDSESPRGSGSTSVLNAGASPGSVSLARLRPPPGARTRPDAPSNSRTPLAHSVGMNPVSCATV